MKRCLLLLFCFLVCLFPFDGIAASGFDDAYLYIRVPSNLHLEKYNYRVDTEFRMKITPRFSYNEVHEPGEVIKCRIWDGPGSKYDSLQVEVKFFVQDKTSGFVAVYYRVWVQMISDSMYCVIPELPDDAIIDALIEQEKSAPLKKEIERDPIIWTEEKTSNKRSWKADLKDFLTDWKSYFLYVNFHQGHRSYGELSFSNARYEEVPDIFHLFSNSYSDLPGFIRGPFYGAEFNFQWRKNEFILGPKIGFNITTRFVNTGFSVVYYTDFTYGLVCLKTRIGLNPGIPWVNFSYEYAIRCGYDYFGDRINRHQFSMYFVIPLRLRESDSSWI